MHICQQSIHSIRVSVVCETHLPHLRFVPVDRDAAPKSLMAHELDRYVQLYYRLCRNLCAIAYSAMCELSNSFPKLYNAYPYKGIYL